MIRAAQIDLVGSVYAGTFTSGGVASRLSANVLPTAGRVSIDGGKIGHDPTGLDRAGYGVINEADMISNRRGAVKTPASAAMFVSGLAELSIRTSSVRPSGFQEPSPTASSLGRSAVSWLTRPSGLFGSFGIGTC